MGRNVFRMSDVAIGNFDAVANGRIVVGSNEIAQ